MVFIGTNQEMVDVKSWTQWDFIYFEIFVGESVEFVQETELEAFEGYWQWDNHWFFHHLQYKRSVVFQLILGNFCFFNLGISTCVLV